MNSLFLNFYGFIKVSRIPNLLIVGITQVLTAFFLLTYPVQRLISVDFILLILTTQMIAAAGYIINDYYDQKIDMINRPERVIVGVTFKRRFALVAHIGLNLIAISIALFVDPLIAIIHLLSATGLWFYSNHLRRLPLLGNLTIAALTGMILLIVSIFFRTSSDLVLMYAFFAFLMTLIREIVKDIEAVKGEAAFGCSTVPVIWGIRGAKVIIYIISLLGSILLLYFLLGQAAFTVKVFFMVLTPFFLLFIRKVHIADTQKEFQNLHIYSNWITFLGIISILFAYG